MTELGRATDALAKEISAFDRQEAVLKTELADAVQARDRARSILMSHQAERNRTLAPFYRDVATAELAEADEQA